MFIIIFHTVSPLFTICLSCGDLTLLVVAVGEIPGNEVDVLLQCSVGPCTLLFSRGGVRNLTFFHKTLFLRQPGFHRFGVLNSFQVFVKHSLFERISYTPCWPKHFSVPCQLRVYSRNWPMRVKWAPFCNFRGALFQERGKGSFAAILEHSGQLKKSGLELLQNPGSLPGEIITQTNNRKAFETVRGYKSSK